MVGRTQSSSARAPDKPSVDRSSVQWAPFWYFHYCTSIPSTLQYIQSTSQSISQSNGHGDRHEVGDVRAVLQMRLVDLRPVPKPAPPLLCTFALVCVC